MESTATINRTANYRGHRTLERSKAAGNNTYKKLAVQRLHKHFYFVTSSAVSDSLVLRDSLLRQAPTVIPKLFSKSYKILTN